MSNYRWTANHHDIQNVFPAIGISAVFAYEIESGKDAGKYRLEAMPIKYLAVCKVTTRHYSDTRGRTSEPIRQIGKDEIHYDVCGIDLSDGFFSVLNKCSNFAGLMNDGDDIRECIGCLAIQIIDRLASQYRSPEYEDFKHETEDHCPA